MQEQRGDKGIEDNQQSLRKNSHPKGFSKEADPTDKSGSILFLLFPCDAGEHAGAP